jgi:hypothetical protein
VRFVSPQPQAPAAQQLSNERARRGVILRRDLMPACLPYGVHTTVVEGVVCSAVSVGVRIMGIFWAGLGWAFACHVSLQEECAMQAAVAAVQRCSGAAVLLEERTSLIRGFGSMPRCYRPGSRLSVWVLGAAQAQAGGVGGSVEYGTGTGTSPCPHPMLACLLGRSGLGHGRDVVGGWLGSGGVVAWAWHVSSILGMVRVGSS